MPQENQWDSSQYGRATDIPWLSGCGIFPETFLIPESTYTYRFRIDLHGSQDSLLHFVGPKFAETS